MNKKLKKVLSIGLLSVMMFVGCSNSNEEDTSNDDKFTIVTSFYPVYISTLNVVKDIPNVEVINMTKPQTGCLHDYQLTTEDMKNVSNADAFIINGAGMESFLDKVIDSNSNLKVIDASEGIELLASDEEHDHDGEEIDAEEEHEHGEENGHVWVSVSNAQKQVNNIAKGLSNIDTENKEKYEENAKIYDEKLENLKNEIHEGLADVSNKDIVTFHESFSYFAKEFGLNIVSVINVEPGEEPSPKQLEETIEEVKEHNVKAIFTEPQYAAKSPQTIASETGAKVYELDPIVTGESNKNAVDDYINKMKKNLEILKEALK